MVHEMRGGWLEPGSWLAAENEGQEGRAKGYESSGSEERVERGGALRGSERTSQVQVQIERPNIFILYEQNIGLLSPLIADELRDAADMYPAEWIETAFREAILHNKRKWSYIRAILRRWETEGRQAWNA